MSLRYIIVGLGNIGYKRKNVLGDKLVATVDIANEDADYKNFKEVPLDLFDAAILSVPNSEKLILIEYFLENKKHIIVEKPILFKNDKEGLRLNKIAEKNNCIWYSSYNHRFEPNIKKLKEFIDQKTIGKIYFSEIIYGNGTVENIKNTWRDSGKGVIEDLGCHLIDLDIFLFNLNIKETNYEIISSEKFEANSVDYCMFARENNKRRFLCTNLMWKNTFKIDIFGSKGSLHLNGLNKWGGSFLILRKRLYPSGIPEEELFEFQGKDESWMEDIDFFEKEIEKNYTTYEKDWFISKSIQSL